MLPSNIFHHMTIWTCLWLTTPVLMFTVMPHLRAHCTTLYKRTAVLSFFLFPHYHSFMPSLPLTYSHFSASTHKPPHVSAVQTDGGMRAPLGSPHGHYIWVTRWTWGGGRWFFQQSSLAGLFLPMFGERKWALCAVGTSLSSPLLRHRQRGRQRD